MNKKFRRNVRKVLSHPAMLRSYFAWTIGRLTGVVTLKSPGGATLAGFRHFSEYWGTILGGPTTGELLLIQRVFAQGGVAIDVGANIGQFTTAIAFASRRAMVHAFEPVRSNYVRLIENIERNKLEGINAHQLAVADRNALVSMIIDEGSPATNRISLNHSQSEIQAIALDDYCSSHGIEQVRFLKIDVEGAEPLVLRGARRMLEGKAINCLLIEICPANLEQFGYSTSDISTPLRRAGYELFRLGREGGCHEALTDSQLSEIRLENIVATLGPL